MEEFINGKRVICKSEDTAHLHVGDRVRARWLRADGTELPLDGLDGIFTVIRLTHEDDKYFYHCPVVEKDPESPQVYMVAPKCLVVVK